MPIPSSSGTRHPNSCRDSDDNDRPDTGSAMCPVARLCNVAGWGGGGGDRGPSPPGDAAKETGSPPRGTAHPVSDAGWGAGHQLHPAGCEGCSISTGPRNHDPGAPLCTSLTDPLTTGRGPRYALSASKASTIPIAPASAGGRALDAGLRRRTIPPPGASQDGHCVPRRMTESSAFGAGACRSHPAPGYVVLAGCRARLQPMGALYMSAIPVRGALPGWLRP